jgi:hypothetical protein
MREDEYARKKRAEIVEVARFMLAGQIDLIEGCRRVVSIASRIGLQDDPTVIPFRGFESETDGFPRGDARKNYAADYLEKLDGEAKEYLDSATTEMLRSCRDLLGRFDG